MSKKTASESKGEWADRLGMAERYLEAQYALMALIVGDEADPTIPTAFDTMRRARVAFAAIPPLTAEQETEASKSNIDGAIKFLETSLTLKKNEALFADWLRSLDEKDVDPLWRFLEQQLALKADPQNDLFMVGGPSGGELRQKLTARGYRRLLEWTDIADPENLDVVDERDIKKKLSALPDMLAVKPQNMWYLDFENSRDFKPVIEQVTNRVNLLYVNRNKIGRAHV